jgi:hypothetical protein
MHIGHYQCELFFLVYVHAFIRQFEHIFRDGMEDITTMHVKTMSS